MRVIAKILLLASLILIISCKNSIKSKKTDNKTESLKTLTANKKQDIAEKTKNSSVKETTKAIDKTKLYNSIEAISDGVSDANYNFKKLELVKINGKIGFIYENGEELFSCIFDSVVDVNNNYNHKVNGKEIVTKGYFSLSYDDNRYAKVKKDGKWGLITIGGKVAIPNIYDEILDFDYTKTSRMEGPYIDFLEYSGNIIVAKKNAKWGLINTKGEVLADFIYDKFFIPDVHLFYENRVAVKKDGKWGFLNEKGIPISSFLYDTVGSTDIENPNYTSTFKGGVAVVGQEGKWGIIDRDGKEITPFIYDYISTFVNESTVAQKAGKWGYLNKKGEEIITIIYDEIKWFERDLCPVKKDGLWGFVNRHGEVAIPMIYKDILVFDEVAVDGGLWFFSQDGYCAVMKNDKWGLIDKDNNTVVNFEYAGISFTSGGLDDWSYFSNGFLRVQKGENWSVVNKAGINHIPFEYDDIKLWSEGNVCVKKNNKWGLLDSLGNQLVPIEYNRAMDAGNHIYK